MKKNEIPIFLSERDFDYELQALVNSFFPGQAGVVYTLLPNPPKNEEAFRKVWRKEAEAEKEGLFGLAIWLGKTELVVTAFCQGTYRDRRANVTGEQDWHRHTDKSAHPYRTYYKNVLKREVFLLLSDYRQTDLPKGLTLRIPQWGTMTGVRPTKIPMGQLLQGKPAKQVGRELAEWYCCSREKQSLCMAVAQREAALLRELSLENSYSLYIGIPFCPTTCLYCSFPSYSLERFQGLLPSYLDALLQELAAMAKLCAGKHLSSVYIGGGTPTTLTTAQLKRLLDAVRRFFPEAESCEFTVEAGRPDSITEEKLQTLYRCGVRRISVNPQTMQQQTLDLIGRRHTVEQTREAFLQARETGFTNINMDLIAGLPGEEPAQFADTLAQIFELNPDSLTVHSLVVKRASRLRETLEAAGHTEWETQEKSGVMEQMLSMAQTVAEQQGYLPYYMYRQKNSAGHFGSSGQENIGFAREGKECLYNILMMEEVQSVAAVGAGASTKIYHPDKKIVSRVENVKSVTDYISRVDEMIKRKRENWL